ncbi:MULTISPECIES: hypothetical protein [Streptomyces violaceusniger group]|uniref:Uncharacterized protein n=2 Tax=Streptomyces rhizosphaericus TaxID=114699 RepID=A0ABN1PG03_9ACTN|nr:MULTISPECIES: hypothetical protein [Streptomyces violaceusniger group]
MILPLVGLLAGLVIQDGWGWVRDKVAGPAEVKPYTGGPEGCIPIYSDQSLADVKKDPDGALKGGVAISNSRRDPAELPITLQSAANQAIVVTGVKIQVLSNKKLPRRGLIIDPDGCGGLLFPRTFAVDLTRAPITATPVPPDTGKNPVDFPFKVSANDPEQLTLRLDPGNRDIRFTVEVNWVTDGEPGKKILDNGGNGYRVMGRSNLPSYQRGKLYQ